MKLALAYLKGHEVSAVGAERGQRREGYLWLHGPNGLNDVQGYGLGVGAADVGVCDQFLRTALHTISITLRNSSCESHTWRLVS